MTRTLEGRIALVTGASRGIGRAAGVALAKAGAHVILNGRTAEKLEALVLDERVDHQCMDFALETRLNRTRPCLRRFRGSGVLQHVVVARACAITAVERVADGFRLGVHRTGETEAELRRDLLVVAELRQIAERPIFGLRDLAANLTGS